MKKGKKWLRLLPFTTLLFWLMVVNYNVDPANIFHNISKEVADSIIAGNRTFIVSGNLDERDVRKNLIISMPDDIETIAIGPSLALCIGEEIAGTDKFFNLAESKADFYDILAQFGLMEVYEKYPGRIIFCVDGYFFNSNIYDGGRDDRHNVLMPYAEYMLGVLDGDEKSIPKTDVFAEKKILFEQLFSISYFQTSAEYMKTNGSLTRIGIADDKTETGYYMPDGSWVYDKSLQKNNIEDVRTNAEEYDVDWEFSKGKNISEYSKNTFEKLIQYLQERDVDIELYLCPLAPSLWDRLNLNEYPVLTELEKFANEVSVKYGLKITGSYNPYILNITDDKFYDSRHVRREYLGVYFDFRKE